MICPPQTTVHWSRQPQWTKGALRRLAQARLQPTPAHDACAYAEEAGASLSPEGSLPARAKPQIDRLVMRVTDDASLRGELASALMDELMALCQALTQRLGDERQAAQDSNPVAVVSSHLRERLDGSHSARAVRAARHLLDGTRTRQRALRSERLLARDAIKQMVREVLPALGGLARAPASSTTR